MKQHFMRVTAVSIAAVLLSGAIPLISLAEVTEDHTGWEKLGDDWYWYEDGVKQGLEGRGKEIYDPDSDAWYWLDSDADGKRAVSKDLYQESAAGQWAENFVEGDWNASTGKWVRYDADGHMIKGWSEDHQYYFDLVYGTMARGYATIDGEEYYFHIETGVKEEYLGEVPEENGWKTMDGADYWYENGIRQGYSIDSSYRGKEIYDPGSGAWYWLDNLDGGKKAVSKDVYQESKADDSGTIGKWVRYDAVGRMIKGWDENEKGRYYFDPVYGTMTKGYKTIDGVTYHFNMDTGICEGETEDSDLDFDETYEKYYNLSWKITEYGKLIVSGSAEGLPKDFDWCIAPWYVRRKEIDIAYMDFKGAESLTNLFWSYQNLQSVDLSNLDTSNVTNTRNMFRDCTSLIKLDLSSFDTRNVTDMGGMFANCTSLTELDLSCFDTRNVTNMRGMFSLCMSLTKLNVSSFDTRNVTDMGIMFEYCTSLTDLDLSSFDTRNVTDMYMMFDSCSSLASLDLSSFDTGKVTSMAQMFYRCSSLTSLNLSSFDTGNVTNMNWMFDDCSSLTSLDLSRFDTSNVTSMRSMFDGCSSLTGLDLSSFDTGNVTSMRSMFGGCSGLTSLDLSSFDTSNVTHMGWMFNGCSSLTSLDLSCFDTDDETFMMYMFYNCSSLKDILVGDQWKITFYAAFMFDGCGTDHVTLKV